jgi:hypothetical protein
MKSQEEFSRKPIGFKLFLPGMKQAKTKELCAQF